MAFQDIFPILLIMLAVLIFAVIGFQRTLGRKRSSAPPPAPVKVPPEEIEMMEGPITACMRCGSPNLRQPRLSEGLIPGAGEGLNWMCGRCRWRGQPLTFEDPTAYRQFVKGLNEDAREADAPQKP